MIRSIGADGDGLQGRCRRCACIKIRCVEIHGEGAQVIPWAGKAFAVFILAAENLQVTGTGIKIGRTVTGTPNNTTMCNKIGFSRRRTGKVVDRRLHAVIVQRGVPGEKIHSRIIDDTFECVQLELCAVEQGCIHFAVILLAEELNEIGRTKISIRFSGNKDVLLLPFIE